MCGIGAEGESIPLCKLNGRLQAVLAVDQEIQEIADQNNAETRLLDDEEEDFEDELELVLQEELPMVNNDHSSSTSESMTDDDSCEA